MKIIEKLSAKQNNPGGEPPVTFAFLGDSVTQGCFEAWEDDAHHHVHTEFDSPHAYHALFAKMLAYLYPTVPVNIVNAGVSGGWAKAGLARLERDVLRFSPDLTVVCFGLNDCQGGAEKIGEYTAALRGIFTALQENGSEVIFLTPNMMATHVSARLQGEGTRRVAAETAERQNGGIMDAYVQKGKQTAAECGVPVCDCYARWKKLDACGVNVTRLLANRINHPCREMHTYFALSLFETMLEN